MVCAHTHSVLSFTHYAPMYTKLEWLVHRVLSFTLWAHAKLRRIHQLLPVWGSLRLAPIIACGKTIIDVVFECNLYNKLKLTCRVVGLVDSLNTLHAHII